MSTTILWPALHKSLSVTMLGGKNTNCFNKLIVQKLTYLLNDVE